MPKIPRGAAQAAIAFMLVIGGFATLVLLFFVTPPAANQRLVDLGLGAFWGAFTTAVAFYLGSSHGSADKDETIRKMATGDATPPPAAS